MALELWLNFTDEKDEPKRVLVEGEKFAIGRTPDNELQIPLNNLSRQHAQIQRFADVFVVADLDSSNGTSLNDEKLEKPVALKNGDKLDLGGLEMEVEIISDKAGANDKKGGGSGGAANEEDEDEEDSPASSASAASANASSSKSESSISPLIFIGAPIFGVLILLLLGGVYLISRGNNNTEIVKNHTNTDFIRTKNTNEDGDPPTNEESGRLGKGNTSTPTNSTPPTNNSVPPTPISTEEIPETPKPVGETAKIEKSSNAFLRLIAKNDPKAFLTNTQISLLNSRITPFKGSSGLAENIRNAKKNASQLQVLAASKDLKPQFLVNAALTKLGNQSGDVVATAREMLDQLSAISKPFGNETADDNLLIIAAYSNNASGESLQTTAGIFTKDNPGSARTIRSIWFFKDKGKLTDAQFEFALRYLAIGTITQNPKDFNVQAEALTF
jgi:hypothetical protein